MYVCVTDCNKSRLTFFVCETEIFLEPACSIQSIKYSKYKSTFVADCTLNLVPILINLC